MIRKTILNIIILLIAFNTVIGQQKQPESDTTGLPVTMLEFKAELNGNSVHLSWLTATEVNNNYFVVERSPDGYKWSKIDQIQGAGNSVNEVEYETSDFKPLTGVSYYRLKQVDYNGEFEIFKIESIYVELTIEDKNQEWLAFPIPTKSVISVIGKHNIVGDIRVFDANGKEVTSILSIEKHGRRVSTIDFATVSVGMYVMTTNLGSKKIYKH